MHQGKKVVVTELGGNRRIACLHHRSDSQSRSIRMQWQLQPERKVLSFVPFPKIDPVCMRLCFCFHLDVDACLNRLSEIPLEFSFAEPFFTVGSVSFPHFDTIESPFSRRSLAYQALVLLALNSTCLYLSFFASSSSLALPWAAARQWVVLAFARRGHSSLLVPTSPAYCPTSPNLARPASLALMSAIPTLQPPAGRACTPTVTTHSPLSSVGAVAISSVPVPTTLQTRGTEASKTSTCTPSCAHNATMARNQCRR
jgi:hypothetical protein